MRLGLTYTELYRELALPDILVAIYCLRIIAISLFISPGTE
jgi:hypothetical protein